MTASFLSFVNQLLIFVGGLAIGAIILLIIVYVSINLATAVIYGWWWITSLFSKQEDYDKQELVVADKNSQNSGLLLLGTIIRNILLFLHASKPIVWLIGGGFIIFRVITYSWAEFSKLIDLQEYIKEDTELEIDVAFLKITLAIIGVVAIAVISILLAFVKKR